MNVVLYRGEIAKPATSAAIFYGESEN
jgi:hypothetical protein